MKRIIIIVAGIFAALTGPGLILPALAFYRNHGEIGFLNVSLLLLGIVLLIAGVAGIWNGFSRRKA